MRFFRLAVLACILPWTSFAEEADITLEMSRVDLVDVLTVYQRLSGKPVFMALDLGSSRVSIASGKILTRAEALEFIPKTLLENYGIEMRTIDQGQTLVFRAKDPKYPYRTDPPAVSKPAKTEAEDDAPPQRRRIRVLNNPR